NGADGRAVNLEVNQRRQETARLDMRLEGHIGQRDDLGGLLVTINHARDESLAANGSGGPLAGLAAGSSFDIDNLRHLYLQCTKPGLPPGVDDAGLGCV